MKNIPMVDLKGQYDKIQNEIDNAVIEIDNEEVPIMDGSAKDFLTSLKKIPIKTLEKKRKYLNCI